MGERGGDVGYCNNRVKLGTTIDQALDDLLQVVDGAGVDRRTAEARDLLRLLLSELRRREDDARFLHLARHGGFCFAVFFRKVPALA